MKFEFNPNFSGQNLNLEKMNLTSLDRTATKQLLIT